MILLTVQYDEYEEAKVVATTNSLELAEKWEYSAYNRDWNTASVDIKTLADLQKLMDEHK